MRLTQTNIPDVVLIEPTVFSDDRGWFVESFNEKRFQQELNSLGLAVPGPFVQDNHSCSHRGVLRGLHYQVAPYGQGKLVRVTRGAAFDVAVDIRPGSATFGRHVAMELSEKNGRMLWIPEGFAHGFLALENDTHFHYKTTSYYHKESERALRWDSPDLGINWPVVETLQVTEKDRNAPEFRPQDFLCFLSANLPIEHLYFKVLGDHRGRLIALEEHRNIPFDIRRVYYIYGTELGIARGFHAHKAVQQVAVCVRGACTFLMDNGRDKGYIRLDSPEKGLFIDTMMWHEMMDFTEDCVLMVLASDFYQEADYIRDYDCFLRAAS